MYILMYGMFICIYYIEITITNLSTPTVEEDPDIHVATYSPTPGVIVEHFLISVSDNAEHALVTNSPGPG